MRALVAGFGNVFFGDDGYGCEVVRTLLQQPPVPGVRVRDFGISGMHLALEMLEPYDVILLVDAIAREGAPGTLFVLEPDPITQRGAPDGHAISAAGVLALNAALRESLGALPGPPVRIVGCVPETTAEGMTLSEPVRAAIPASVELIRRLLREHAAAQSAAASQGA